MREQWEWDWFCCMNPVLRVDDTRGIIASLDGKIAAMAVLDNWLEGSVQIHLVVVRPIVARHGFPEAVFNAAFGEDRPMVLGWVPSVKTKALKLNKHLGFNEIHRLDEGFSPGVDYVLMQLLRKDCKYLGE